ncbi:hypothetical protein C8D94_1136 [Marinirhabdus gelatinilytica]|uniref:Uncharacterized protein n=1 Tax=Marinirhabdus gelatinilytica TaxID=1703343 RepID=A0A370Q372_9FLAO|nr:hypothetical protein C8D94_1136 [Marinirhabdus gelatinilytica]
MVGHNEAQRLCIRIVGLKTVANHSDETQAKFKNLATLQMRLNHSVLLQLPYYFYTLLCVGLPRYIYSSGVSIWPLS